MNVQSSSHTALQSSVESDDPLSKTTHFDIPGMYINYHYSNHAENIMMGKNILQALCTPILACSIIIIVFLL